MEDKITKCTPTYPKGHEPNYIIPSEYCDHRFAIGRLGNNPLVVICMNPSAANDESSDKTINRIIAISEKLGMDGWVVFNTYPERATDAKMISKYDGDLSKQNINIICDFLIKHNVYEVWAAWGDDCNNAPLVKGKKQMMARLNHIGVGLYYYGTLTKSGNPRHPLQRKEKINYISECKHYL